MKVHMFVNVSKAMSEMDELAIHNRQLSLLKHPNNPLLEVVFNQPSQHNKLKLPHAIKTLEFVMLTRIVSITAKNRDILVYARLDIVEMAIRIVFEKLLVSWTVLFATQMPNVSRMEEGFTFVTVIMDIMEMGAFAILFLNKDPIPFLLEKACP